jgi:zinc protease
VTEPDFLPMLLLDAALTGAKGLNIWSSFRGPAPQRKARLYTALVERGLASVVSGALLPTADPFLYSISLIATEGIELARLEAALVEAIERVREDGITEAEAARARRQLRARLAFENDSVTNVAHQLGYFDVVAGSGFLADVLTRIDAVTAEQVSKVARTRLAKTSRTLGWFEPIEQGS